MGTNLLTLPVDIPWRRLCVTEDMIDTTQFGDDQFPPRWQSSIAIFTYEPPEDAQIYDNMIVSYVKVTCTITGFEWRPQGSFEPQGNAPGDPWWEDPDVADYQVRTLNRYYGAYGAILQIVVQPGKEYVDRVAPGRWPYFTDFEPKKRELYETVTDTGENLSRTLESVNVNKGLTTADSAEVLDVFSGSSSASSGGASFLGIGASGSTSSSIQGQWGSKDLNSAQYNNVRTSDQARESRESTSHTTQLTQMYHQLDSYHVGTNRAMFFLLPRPHIKQVPNGFVNGPRELEGIQEFFLVVMRPKDIARVCLEARLETAHLAGIPTREVHDTKVETVDLRITHRVNATDVEGAQDSRSEVVRDSTVYSPPEGWEIDLSRHDGYRRTAASGNRQAIPSGAQTSAKRMFRSVVGDDDERQVGGRSARPSQDRVSDWGHSLDFDDEHPDSLTLRGWAKASFHDVEDDNNQYYDGRLDVTYEVYLRRIEPTVTTGALRPWLVPRAVSCCEPLRLQLPHGSVSWESAVPLTSRLIPGPSTKMSIGEANRIRTEVGQAMLRSMGHPDRYPPGAVLFPGTHFHTSAIGALLDKSGHPDNQRVADIADLAGLDDQLRTAIGDRTRAQVLRMPLAELIGRFELTLEQATALHAALLRGSVPSSPEQVWDLRNRLGRVSLRLQPPDGAAE